MDRFADLIGFLILAAIAAVAFGLGLAPVLFFGLAWGILSCILIAGVAYRLTPGDMGYAYVYFGGLICLVAGFVVGLITRALLS